MYAGGGGLRYYNIMLVIKKQIHTHILNVTGYYSTRNVIFYKINERIGLTHDTIEYMHDRTKFTHDTIRLKYDMIG